MMNKPYLPWSRWLKTSGYGTDDSCNGEHFIHCLYTMSGEMMLCAGWLEPVGLFSSLKKVNIFLNLWSAASQSVGHFLATCILAARAPYMELSSLVIAWWAHPQTVRQQGQATWRSSGMIGGRGVISAFFQHEPVCPSCCRDDCICISLKVGLFINKLTPEWW